MICLELPTRDHPRVCGEHDHIGHGGIRVKGSSPRVRGTPGRRVCAQAMRGIIPACAGNTLRPSHASSMHGDHPRVCGEHSGEGGEPEPKSGSSPRVRGTLRDGLGSCLHAGIIPACAGNTAYVLSAFSSSRDHPRVCGEHELPELRQAAIRGSSPRVRGTPPAQPIRLLLAGIIPACAGNTLWRVVCYVRGRDHPRVCGEHSLMPSPSSSASGSSPRVRGTPDGRRKSVEDMGIIPACAGNTVCCHSLFGSWWDHPRVCGEHPVREITVSFAMGSSPRVRGTRHAQRADGHGVGIIPACAGNTK